MRSGRNNEDMWEVIAKEMPCSIDEAQAWHFTLGQEDLLQRAMATPDTQTLRPRNEPGAGDPGGDRDDKQRFSERFPEGS
jgi:hypothetical protein